MRRLKSKFLPQNFQLILSLFKVVYFYEQVAFQKEFRP